jgi:hypothetical protein
MSDLAAFHDWAWEVLRRGVADREAAARVMALATVAADGTPEVRSVILRAADRGAGTVDVHTDARSAKVAALRAMPHAAAVVWDPVTRVQVRLSGEVAVLQGAAVAGDWDRVPRAARVSYGNDPAPGWPIAGPEDYVAGEGAGVFAVLRLSVAWTDVLHLGDMHRRALFRRTDGWQGQWLSP